MAPVSVVYNPEALKQNENSEGCYMVKGFQAQWVSGALSVIDPIKLCGSAIGNYNITLVRQPSAPNLEKDLQFALKLQSVRAQQRQAQAASEAAAAAMWSAWSNSQENRVSCTTKKIGDSVYTNCN